MNCPKCNKSMVAVTYRKLQIDRCPECQGMWLDKKELQHIMDNQLAGLLDVGAFTPATPERDAIPAHCYKCNKDMITLTGAADVRFDWCDQCEGMFFDKGEVSIMQAFEAE